MVPSDRAVMIVGYRIIDLPGLSPPKAGLEGSWVSVDGKTGLRNAQEMPWFTFRGGILASRDTQYTIHFVHPGLYALGWLQYEKSTFEPTIFESIQTTSRSSQTTAFVNRTFSRLARVRANTPIFGVAPGEVIYAGDIVLDFSTEKRVKWTFTRSDDSVRQLLSKTGLADRMITRIMRRADAKPLELGDGVGAQ